MDTPRPDPIASTASYVISVAAQLAGMHAQTLRSYDREGLVSPERTSGGGRRYSDRDIELLREVQRLSQDEGVNRAGIRRIIELEAQVDALQSRVTELIDENAALVGDLAAAQIQIARSTRVSRTDLVPYTPTTSIVRWQPRNR